MILPSHEECRRVLDDLEDEPNLTPWEQAFIENNEERTWFTDSQRSVIARFKEKYEV